AGSTVDARGSPSCCRSKRRMISGRTRKTAPCCRPEPGSEDAVPHPANGEGPERMIPEKWTPVFGKDHAPPKSWCGMTNRRSVTALQLVTIARCEAALHAPLLQDLVGGGRHEIARALLVVTLAEKLVVVGEDVPHIGNQGQPCGGFGVGRSQAGAVEGVVHDGGEFMGRNSRRQPA